MKNDARLAHAWEEIKARNLDEAERVFEEEAIADPADADAWNGLGAVRFERADLEASLEAYKKALTVATAAHGGSLPSRLPWDDAHKPALRAIQGIGLNLYRMGDLVGARERFEELLRRNPDDNQGAGMLLRDIARKADLWKKDKED